MSRAMTDEGNQLSSEWEADLLKVVSITTKLGVHCTIKWMGTKKFSPVILSDTVLSPPESNIVRAATLQHNCTGRKPTILQLLSLPYC